MDGLCPLCLLSFGLQQDLGEEDSDSVTAIRGDFLLPAAHSGNVANPLTPGTVIAGRFRVTSLLGRGGMGEVYRADDLKLGEAVALKFLPAGRTARWDAERFVYDEVRLARQITHPNVCRVHEVFDIAGRPFIEMELVDGENLASLLTRIGRLSYAKALEIGRDVCAGLDAAHQKGIVHGDLKPANILIDGHGRARITDFGLARLSADSRGRGHLAGTIAYMAPEHLMRNEVSTRSDIYALGLVLYEIFTGVRARQAATLEELRTSMLLPPLPPSNIQPRLDGALEETILRCLAPDPAQRPATAREVADAFPAGEPLASMIAAGDTPPAEIVAASATVPRLRVRDAAALFITFLVALALLVAISGRLTLYGRVPLPKAPIVLADRAAEAARSAGWRATAADHGFWFEAVAGGTIEFHWRASPTPMLPLRMDGRLRRNDPPLDVPGMVHVVLDSSGAPLRIDVVTAAGSPAMSAGASPAAIPPARLPHVVYLLLLALTLVAGAWLARRNIRARRIDRKAAVRVALCVFTCRMLYGLLAGHHPLALEKEAAFLQTLLAASVLLAFEVWLAYAALEPLVRRIAPHALITWTRLVHGRARDAVVGRDLLIGIVAGVTMRFLDHVRNSLPMLFPSLNILPSHLAVDALASTRVAAGIVFLSLARAIFYALFALFFFILLRNVLRSTWAAGLVWLVATTIIWSRWEDGRVDAGIVGLQMLIVLALLIRAGLLAATVALCTFLIAVFVPLTADVSAFYFSHSVVALIVLVSIGTYGLQTALGRRSA